MPRESAICPLTEDDLDAIMDIEQHAFSQPWPEEDFIQSLNTAGSYQDGVVHLTTGRLFAYIVYHRYHDEVHILNLATAIEARYQGHASHLLEHVLAFAGMHRISRICLEVRRSNRAALALYSKFGFQEIGINKEYYLDTRQADGPVEDAIIMRWTV